MKNNALVNDAIALRFAEAGSPKTPPDRLQQLVGNPNEEASFYFKWHRIPFNVDMRHCLTQSWRQCSS